MDEEDTIQNELNKDSDDDDCEEYFLQSTPGPYDIREKIRAANDELFDDYEAYNIAREQKVTFREELVDYEPDFSSDDGYVHSPDVLSVISDNENETEEINHQLDESFLPTEDNDYNNPQETTDNFEQCDEIIIINEHDIFENKYFDNDDSNDTVINNTIEEEIIDECEEDIEESFVNNEDIEEENFEEQIVEIVEIINDDSPDEKNITSSSSSESKSVNSPIIKREEYIEDNSTKKNPLLNVEKVNCRLHCLEKKELDFINGKTKIFEENFKGPVLKLRQRSCCTNQPFKPKLPTYNGFISEYGMTKSQLERKQRKKEKSVQKKKEKIVKINEEKKQKDLYNEEIFCAWLKSLQNRNQNGNKENATKKCSKQRPSTAPHCNLSLAINKPKIKRPSTSSSCSYKIIFE